jgi:hypothetical protein
MNTMDTEQLMTDAEKLTLNMGLREGPRNVEDQIGIAQILAMLAIANELKRLNDSADDDRAYEAYREEVVDRQ